MATAKSKLSKELAAAFTEDVGAGFEMVTSESLQIPFIEIVQAQSKVMKKGDAKYNPKLSVGDIYNSVTGQSWSPSEGILVLPVHFEMKWVEWSKGQGGDKQFVGIVPDDSPRLENLHEPEGTYDAFFENGNEALKTAHHYVKIVHEDQTLESALITMARTKLKKSRQWISMMMMRKHNGKTMPSFANTYRLTTDQESNVRGSWETWIISPESTVPSLEAYEECKEFYTSINSGELAVAGPQPMEAVTDQSEEVPF